TASRGPVRSVSRTGPARDCNRLSRHGCRRALTPAVPCRASEPIVSSRFSGDAGRVTDGVTLAQITPRTDTSHQNCKERRRNVAAVRRVRDPPHDFPPTGILPGETGDSTLHKLRPNGPWSRTRAVRAAGCFGPFASALRG